MEVDGALVHGGVCGCFVNGSEQTAGALLDDLDRATAAAADVGEVGGALATCPVPACRPPPQQLRGFELRQEFGHSRTEERDVVFGERHFRRRGTQVRGEDVRVVRIQDGRLHGLLEERLGVVDEEGVQRVVTGDEDGEGALTRAPGTPGLLPEGGPGARVVEAMTTASSPETSMPSSRAVVAASPSSSPECRARSRARRSSGR